MYGMARAGAFQRRKADAEGDLLLSHHRSPPAMKFYRKMGGIAAVDQVVAAVSRGVGGEDHVSSVLLMLQRHGLLLLIASDLKGLAVLLLILGCGVSPIQSEMKR